MTAETTIIFIITIIAVELACLSIQLVYIGKLIILTRNAIRAAIPGKTDAG